MKNEVAETQERATKYKAELEQLKEKNEEVTKDLKAKDIVFNSNRIVEDRLGK
jgi:hypothetical protein